jgi:hypothetical protein
VLQPDRALGTGGAGTVATNGGGGAGAPRGAGDGDRGNRGEGGTRSTADVAGSTAGVTGSTDGAGVSAGTPGGQASNRAGTGGSGAEPQGAAGEPSADASVASSGPSDAAAGDAATPGDADNPVMDAGSTQPAAARDPDCDFNGIWIAKQVTVSEALGLPQSSNNWYFLELAQSGTEVRVSRHFDCGIEVAGSATVTLSRASLQALTMLNPQVGRTGTVTKQAERCAFELERFWSIRGAEARFLPNGMRDVLVDIADLALENPLPAPGRTEGAIDVEMDGKPGVAVQVSGIISGTRNSVQRDWTHWFTEPGFEITPSTDWPDELRIRADFDNEESILDPRSGLLVSNSTPRASAKHIVRLRFLGRDASDPRAARVVKDDAVETCFAIQDALQVETLE